MDDIQILSLQHNAGKLKTEVTSNTPLTRDTDHTTIDWAQVQQCRYLLHQRFAYEYPCPVTDLAQRLMILPPEQYGRQRRSIYRFEVSPSTDLHTIEPDAFGNSEIKLFISTIDNIVRFEAWIEVERSYEEAIQDLPSDLLTDHRLLEPSPLTQPDDALRTLAAELHASGSQGLALAQEINRYVYQYMRYAHDVTTIRTTAAQALALGRGVCQDYAHLMLALCRLCGLPARYVSGHLLGEGGTHAWVEVIVPSTEHPGRAAAIPLDPTHGRATNLSYLTIAVGRDYYDVAPTSGTFRAACHGELRAYKQVTLLEYL